MTRTPETLARHELVGLDVRVTAAANPDLLGIEGEVVAETTNTLHVEAEPRVWQVPKAGATLAFDVSAEPRSADSRAAKPRDGGQTVSVDGERLVARPARRTETTGDSQWR